MAVVLVTGGFDPVHSGHIEYFKDAAKLGQSLVVGLNSDEWLTRKKGQPFMSFDERKAVIENLRMVDQVIAFDDLDNTACDAIQQLLDDGYRNIIFANGGDRTNTSTPEYDRFEDNPWVGFAWGVGGEDKKNSSSWILENWKNPKTIRPWGHWRVLDDKGTVKVKELVIDPGCSLSDQKHNFRSERWYILKGSCDIQTEWNGLKNSVTLAQHDNYVIEKDVWHLTKNIGDTACHVLEIQYGEHCLEEDIQRR